MKIAYQPTLVASVDRAITLNYTDDGSPPRSIIMFNASLETAIDPSTRAVTATVARVDGDGLPMSDPEGAIQQSATDPASEDAAIKAAALALAPRVLPAPVLDQVSPNSGPSTGGTEVTIEGHNLVGATAVTFGDTAAAGFQVQSATRIAAVSPAGSPGAEDVKVTVPGGSDTQKAAFTYQ